MNLDSVTDAITICNMDKKQTDAPHVRLQFARIAAGYRTAKEFSDKHGFKQSTYHVHESGERGLKLAVAQKYAQTLGNCDAAWLLTGGGHAPAVSSNDDGIPKNQPFINQEADSLSHQAVNESIEFNAIPAPDAALPPLMTSMPKDVPVLGTAECGPDGVFEMNGGDALDFVRRPPGLMGNKNAFAVWAQGDSMRPMFRSGDLVYVDPNRPAEIDRAVLVEFHALDGEHPRGMLKILVKISSEFIELRQLNPDNSDKPMRFARKKIKRIYRVLTNQDMMGF